MEPEIIEIGNDSTTAPMKLNLGSMGGSSSSSSSIPGIELLMNDKKGSMKSSSSGDDGIHVDDLANLESELNDLTTSLPGGNDITPRVNFATSDESGKTEIKLDEIPTINTPSVGEYTSDAMEKDKTWDGFGTFQNIPIEFKCKHLGNCSFTCTTWTIYCYNGYHECSSKLISKPT